MSVGRATWEILSPAARRQVRQVRDQTVWQNVFLVAERPVEVVEPCNPSPCGRNAECSQQRGAASCRCVGDYTGNPYIECRPECVVSQECPASLACISQHCRDPCPGLCGLNAKCRVVNHAPQCSCVPGFTGDAFTSCQRVTTRKTLFFLSTSPPTVCTVPTPTEIVDPCSPSPCGDNAVCQTKRRAAACQCVPGYFGDPYIACRPECVINQGTVTSHSTPGTVSLVNPLCTSEIIFSGVTVQLFTFLMLKLCRLSVLPSLQRHEMCGSLSWPLWSQC